MKVRTIEFYQLEGLRGSVTAETFELLSNSDASIRIVQGEDDAEIHLRRRFAYGNILASSMSGRPLKGKTLLDRFDNAMFLQRRPLRQGEGALLITEYAMEVDSWSLQHMNDLGSFAFALDPIDEKPLVQKVRELRGAAVAALALTGFEQATHGGKRIGHVAMLEPDNGRLIYSTTIEATISVSSIHALLPEQVVEATTFTRALFRAPRSLRNVPRLLATSHETRNDPLRSFVSAWTGLELLIGAVFGAYEESFRASVRGQVKSGGGIALDRMFDVMKDKYRLLDKFAIVAGALAPETSEEDIERFSGVKKVRDRFFHTMSGDLGDLPTQETQRLLRKYLRLYLSETA